MTLGQKNIRITTVTIGLILTMVDSICDCNNIVLINISSPAVIDDYLYYMKITLTSVSAIIRI